MNDRIDVSPLVDVSLVLLVILMLAWEKLDPGRRVSLPRAMMFHSSCSMCPPEPRIVIAIDDRGRPRIWWDAIPVESAAELQKMFAARANRPGRPLVKADSDLRYADVHAVLAALHAGGAESVFLGTREMN